MRRTAHVLLLSSIVLAILGCGTTASRPTAAAADLPTPITVITISAHRTGPAVPRGFPGLSFEAASLPQVAGLAGRGNLVELLRSLGPGLLRFGGVSSDTQVAWADVGRRRPSWANTLLSATTFRRLAQLSSRSHWRVLLTLSLAHFDSARAGREAAAAKAALGKHLEAVEIGNEPDSYAHHGLREDNWDPARYAVEAAAYRRAIELAAPGVAIAGPSVSGSHAFTQWGPVAASSLAPALLTGHHYPLGCNQLPPPSIPLLLSPQVRRLEESSLQRYMAVAKTAHIPFRMDETGSVSCGGRASISDTFAGTLWALDYIVRTMQAGVVGMNFHGNLANCSGYSPLCAPTPAALASGTLQPQPEWYALVLAHTLVGERPLKLSMHPRHPDINAAAFLGRTRHTIHVVLLNEASGSATTVIHLHVAGAFKSARVLALTAPSLDATSGIEVGSQSVADDGSWWSAKTPLVSLSGGSLSVSLAAGSATLVTLLA